MRISNCLHALFLAFAPLLLASCASIIASGPDAVQVSSDPEGARVSLDGQLVGVTPLMVMFPRSSTGMLRFELAGYDTRTLHVGKVVNGWLFGNVIFGLLGVVIDIASNNHHKTSTDAILVELAERRPTVAGETARRRADTSTASPPATRLSYQWNRPR